MPLHSTSLYPTPPHPTPPQHITHPFWLPPTNLTHLHNTHMPPPPTLTPPPLPVQYKPIRTVRFVVAGTIEERILKLQEKKQAVFEGTVGEA